MRFYFICLFAVPLILLSASGDASSASPLGWSWQEFCGRDEEPLSGKIEREKIYRAKVPSYWERIDPSPKSSLFDTMLPLCEFVIEEGEGAIHIVIHNFPSDRLESRIPPQAQTARWKKQFTSLDPIHQELKPQAFSGYSGLYFEGEGEMKGKRTAMIAWALQLGNEHYRRLQEGISPDPLRKQRQMRADVTLKATGPIDAIHLYRPDIIAFARSFEIIDDISYSQ